MQIKFIGTGGAFDHEYGNSSALVSMSGKHILIDCGYNVYPRLAEKQVVDLIDYIVITHLHDDHAGSLATALLHRKHRSAVHIKPTILYPNEEFLADVQAFLAFSLLKPDNYAHFAPIQSVQGVGAIETTNLHAVGMKSFAYYFRENDELILYSGDIGQPELLFEFLGRQQAGSIRVFHEMCFANADGVHTHYKKLIPYLKQYEIYAYHLNPQMAPADNPIPLVYHQPAFML
ncbi:MAG: ribonuclease Z [Bacteroidetes bacterium]|nr:MAG: ribonuclease Z [Bacteroidota bacterium]